MMPINFQAAMKKSTPEATESICAWFKKIEGASRKDAVVRVGPKDATNAAVIGGPGPEKGALCRTPGGGRCMGGQGKGRHVPSRHEGDAGLLGVGR